MQYLLNFITIRTTITSSHKPYRKTLAIGWEFPSKNPKKLMAEATCTRLILYGDIEKVKQFMGILLKSRKLSSYVHSCHKRTISLYQSGWMNQVASTGNAVSNSQANGVCEGFMGSLRWECLDNILIHDDRQLEQVAKEYTLSYFNQKRPHQGNEQWIPDQYELPRSKPTSGHIILKAILRGLHHSYSRTTYLNWPISFTLKLN